MKRPNLKVDKRELQGKLLRKLRREGILPANVYGKDFASTSVQLSLKEFQEVHHTVGETGLVDLEIDGTTLPVLIKNVHIDPRTQTPLHADFHKVNLKQKITAHVPLEIVGESKAVVDNIGILINQLSEIEVEALPTELPEKIEVNVENLAEIGAQILVSDLKMPADVAILNDPSQTIARIAEPVQEEEPEPEEPAEGEEGAESEEGEATEGAEGEEKKEEGSEGEKKNGHEGKKSEKGEEDKKDDSKKEEKGSDN